ncbi:hypothetical protein GUJ93_ZPchr0006g43470 [Zizania palustris]|uniref:Uncharacterized protein n=1 Tax=Zizania palustris TaxID=103762 RepID=A0A8J5W3Q8_ZIZPA|nr:hypothetical protein GUJ93_ZPchr0006g43470 [Zizania palustris]
MRPLQAAVISWSRKLYEPTKGAPRAECGSGAHLQPYTADLLAAYRNNARIWKSPSSRARGYDLWGKTSGDRRCYRAQAHAAAPRTQANNAASVLAPWPEHCLRPHAQARTVAPAPLPTAPPPPTCPGWSAASTPAPCPE